MRRVRDASGLRARRQALLPPALRAAAPEAEGGGGQVRRWVVPGCVFEEFRCTFERFPLEVPEVRLPPTHKYLRMLPRGWRT